jgi:hypothetical protein
MSHPAIPPAIVREHLDDLKAGEIDDLTDFATNVGDGAPIMLGEIDHAVDSIRAALDARLGGATDDLDVDQFEGKMAEHVYRAVSGLPIEVLDDPGFWAYLAAGRLWFFTRWREDPETRNTETYHVYVDGIKGDMCVPLRMFLRAKAVAEDDDFTLTSAVPAGTDFWRSHLLRVKSGGKKELARAIVAQQRDDRMTVGPLREYAKRINRRWSNQVIQTLDAAECEEIATSERP